MSTGAEPITSIRALFADTARAAVRTQSALDAYAEQTAQAGAGRADGFNTLHAIPRVVVGLDFGLQAVNQRRVLLPFWRADKRRQLHEHHMEFSVVATPEPPPPPARVAAGGDLLPPALQLIQPHFIVPKAQHESLIDRLVAAMLDEQRWDFAVPPGEKKPNKEKVVKEAGRIRPQDGDPPEDDPERGMIVLQLEQAPPSYLLVRVTKKEEKDGLFVLAPTRTPEVMIYSFEGDGVDKIVYEPLHGLALAIRSWLAGAPPLRLSYRLSDAPASPTELGVMALKEFADQMAGGYVAAVEILSRQEPPSGLNTFLPSYFDVADAKAELRYSVYFNEPTRRLEFSFGPRMRPDGQSADSELGVVESRAAVRVYRVDNLPRVDLELVAPEFVLSGAGRRLAMAGIDRSKSDVAGKFNAINPESYLQFLVGDTFRAGAVFFLSYEGNVPEPKLLVVWPAFYAGEARDFVFTCELEGDDAETVKLVNVERVLALEEDIEVGAFAPGAQAAAAPPVLSKEKYKPFHNFFHAVRIWSFRMQV
ncbi:MAG TPA: hypothetical protein VF591_21855 [Pyrinomonadaceae bacterium]|jgi:hypothetical protein